MWASIVGCAVLVGAAAVIPAAIAILIAAQYMDE